MTGRHRARGSDKCSEKRRKIDLRGGIRKNKGAVLPSYAVGLRRICAVRTRHVPWEPSFCYIRKVHAGVLSQAPPGVRERTYHRDTEAWPTVFTSSALLHVTGPRTKERCGTENKAVKSSRTNCNAPSATATWC